MAAVGRVTQASPLDRAWRQNSMDSRPTSTLSSRRVVQRHHSRPIYFPFQRAASAFLGRRHGVGLQQELGKQSLSGAQASQARRNIMLAHRGRLALAQSTLQENGSQTRDSETAPLSRSSWGLQLLNRLGRRLLCFGSGRRGSGIHDVRNTAGARRGLRFQDHSCPARRSPDGLDSISLFFLPDDGSCVSAFPVADVFSSEFSPALSAQGSEVAQARTKNSALHGRHDGNVLFSCFPWL